MTGRNVFCQFSVEQSHQIIADYPRNIQAEEIMNANLSIEVRFYLLLIE